MKRTRLAFPAVVTLFAGLVIVVISDASPADNFIRRSAIVSSSGTVANGEVHLTGSLGQAITGASAGTSTQLQAGFWEASTSPSYHVLIPLMLNGCCDNGIVLETDISISHLFARGGQVRGDNGQGPLNLVQDPPPLKWLPKILRHDSSRSKLG